MPTSGRVATPTSGRALGSICAAVLAALLLWLASAHSAYANPAGAAAVIDLVPGQSHRVAAEDVRVLENFDGAVDERALAALRAAPLADGDIAPDFGAPGPRTAFLVSLRNNGSEPGYWIYRTERASLPEFELHVFRDGVRVESFTNADKEAAREMLRKWYSYAWPVSLEPGEDVEIVILFRAEQTSFFDLRVFTVADLLAQQRFWHRMTALTVSGLLTLALVTAIMFAFTRVKVFAGLAALEVASAFIYLHGDGATTIYAFPTNMTASVIAGDVIRATAVISAGFYGLFIFRELGSRPLIRRIMGAMIGLAGAVILLQPVSLFWPASWKFALHGTAWSLLLVASGSVLSSSVWAATRGLSPWLNWTITALSVWITIFLSWVALSSLGLFGGLSPSYAIAGPGFLAQMCVATLAIGFYIRATADTARNALREQVVLSRQAAEQARARASAVATLADQASLIHASGHDARTVIHSLNSTIAHMQRPDVPSDPEVLGVLRAATDYLGDIVRGTITGARMTPGADSVPVFETICVADVLEPMGYIHGAQARRKGLRLVIEPAPELHVAGERAGLMRALSNVISNAIRYTDAGEVRVQAQTEGGHVVFKVSDTGPGFPPSMLFGRRGNVVPLRAGAVSGDTPTDVLAGSGDFLSASFGSGLAEAISRVEAMGGSLGCSNGHDGARVAIRLSVVDVEAGPVRILPPRIHGCPVIEFGGGSDVLLRSEVDAGPVIVVTPDASVATLEELTLAHVVVLVQPVYREIMALVEDALRYRDDTERMPDGVAGS